MIIGRSSEVIEPNPSIPSSILVSFSSVGDKGNTSVEYLGKIGNALKLLWLELFNFGSHGCFW